MAPRGGTPPFGDPDVCRGGLHAQSSRLEKVAVGRRASSTRDGVIGLMANGLQETVRGARSNEAGIGTGLGTMEAILRTPEPVVGGGLTAVELEPSREPVVEHARERRAREATRIARVRAELLDRVARGELSVRDACVVARISRARFYQLRAAYREHGMEGLRPKTERPDLRLPPLVESAVVAFALLNPERGERAIARALARPDLGGIRISRHGVGEVLRRNGLSRREARIEKASLGDRPRPRADVVVGEPNWFASIYEKHRAFVYRVCLHKLGDQALAEDATQETFIKVYTHISRFDSRRSILPWLRRIASNVCVDVHRRNGPVLAKDPTESSWFEAETSDEPIDVVVANERRAKLTRALKTLPERQRRALLLHVLEGWNLNDIAAIEETSPQAVKSLLFRARESLRVARENGLLGVLGLPIRRIQLRVARSLRENASLITTVSPLGASQLSTLILGIAMALAPIAGTGDVVPPKSQRLTAPGRAAALTPTDTPVRAAEGRTAAGGTPSQYFSSDRLTNGLSSLTNPNRDVKQPEDTQITSITFSPAYESDHTVFAMGLGGRCAFATCESVLFRSTDGGGSWTRLAAQGLYASQLLLPPTYPAERRLFASGGHGLFVSLDDGETFESPPLSRTFPGPTAISPLFGDKDSVMLVGTNSLVAFLAGLDVFVPTSYSAVSVGSLQPAYSPDYARDHLVVAGGARLDISSGKRGVVFLCSSEICQSRDATANAPRIRFDPAFARSKLLYAFDERQIVRWSWTTLSFEPLGLTPSSDGIADLVVIEGGHAMFVAMDVAGAPDAGGVFGSYDGGATWSRAALPGGATRATVLSAHGDVIIAGLSTRGIACSIDRGFTWQSRCRP